MTNLAFWTFFLKNKLNLAKKVYFHILVRIYHQKNISFQVEFARMKNWKCWWKCQNDQSRRDNIHPRANSGLYQSELSSLIFIQGFLSKALNWVFKGFWQLFYICGKYWCLCDLCDFEVYTTSVIQTCLIVDKTLKFNWFVIDSVIVSFYIDIDTDLHMT